MGSEVVSYTGAKWIPWGNMGTQGTYPQRIAETFQNSKTLRSVLTQKSNLVAAPLQTESAALQTKIDKLASPKKRDTLQEIFYKVALDFQLHGEGFIKEIRYIEYAGETAIKERSFVSHLDASQVRFSSDTDEDLDPVAVYISKNWLHYSKREYKPYRLPLAGHGYEMVLDDAGKPIKKICIHRIEDYEPGMQIYGRANWTGAYYDAVLEQLLPRWNYVHLNNSIHLSGILNVEMPFVPDDSTATEIRDRIRSQLKGSEAFGPSTPVNITGGDGKLSLIQYNLPTEGAFKDLSRTCERNIIMSAGWHPALMGVEEAGKLGNVREIENHHERAMSYEIEPLQQKILKVYLNTLVGTDYEQDSRQYPIQFINDTLFKSVDYVSQNKIDQAIPMEQVQEDLGYLDKSEEEPLPQGAMSLEEVQRLLEVYGTAVRSGGVTPNIDDETALRKMMNLPAINGDVRQGWQDERGVRKPTTLKNPSQNVEEVSEDNIEQNQE